MMASIGFSLSRVIREENFFLPIVHAEADYKKALFVDDPIELHLRVEKLGDSSYTLFHEITNATGELVGTVRTVHVVIDKQTRRKRAIPDKLRAALTAL